MQINDLRAPKGAKTRRKIIGRGKGSGSGKTAGRGQGRNQGARAGRGIMQRLEGGQMPLMKRLPKVGFRSRRPTNYQLVDVQQLANFKAGAVVSAQILKEKRLVRNIYKPYKILGEGELKNPLTIQAYSFSKTAAQKITASGGKMEIVTGTSLWQAEKKKQK